MELDFRAFAFIITLAAVINALGIVRLLGGLAEYLRSKGRIAVSFYWVYLLWVTWQFLMHIVLWWTLLGAQKAEAFNFFTYLYLLAGPVFLYLGTSLLLPEVEDNGIDLQRHYFRFRKPYFTVSAMLWVWAIFFWPVMIGQLSPTLPILGAFLAIALTLRFTEKPAVHSILVVAAWLLTGIMVFVFLAPLGGVATTITNQ
jgi:hypothetical protein